MTETNNAAAGAAAVIDLAKNAEDVIKTINDCADLSVNDLAHALESEKTGKKRTTVMAALNDKLTALSGTDSAPPAEPPTAAGASVDINAIEESKALADKNLLSDFIAEYGSAFATEDEAIAAVNEFLDKDRNDPLNPTQLFTHRNRIIEATTQDALVNGPPAKNKPKVRHVAQPSGTVLINGEVYPLYNPQGPAGTHQQWDWHFTESGSKLRVSFHPDDVAAVRK